MRGDLLKKCSRFSAPPPTTNKDERGSYGQTNLYNADSGISLAQDPLLVVRCETPALGFRGGLRIGHFHPQVRTRCRFKHVSHP